MTVALRRVPVVLLGPGAVGQALLRRIVARRDLVAGRHGLRLAVVAVADASGAQLGWGGEIDDARLRDLADGRAGGRRMADWPGAAPREAWLAPETAAGGDAAPIVVDTTAADTTRMLLAARERGWRLVLANKVPLTGELEAFHRLTQSGRGARWETTVASTLPVIATLQALQDAGDAVRRISGSLSGTLGFVAKRIEEGGRLSDIVTEADAMGYLEPDPRTDLSGLDAARKLLILARMVGLPLTLADVAVDRLYPAAWDDLDVAAFRERLPALNDALSGRAAAAALTGHVLRYIGVVEGGTARAGLADVEPDDRLARVEAGDSIVVFETANFSANPLVISGRGGGPAVTAAGVMADVVSLARADA